MKALAVRTLSSYGILAALVLELVVFGLLSDDFLSVRNQINILRGNAAIAIIAAGMTFVILTAGIDLSVGSLLGVSCVLTADVILGDWAPMPVRIAVGCVVGVTAGALAGAFNGIVATRMRIPPFVATLAMLTIARGVAYHYTGSRTISGLPEGFHELSNSVAPIGVMLAVYLAGWVVLMRTPFGRHVYAVGGNPEAARLCGIRVDRVLRRVYLLSGALAGLAGVLVASRLNAGYPKAGELAELDAIAAVVVGGTSLMGGRGSIWGTLIGALVIGELVNGLELMHVSYYSQKIIIGVVLIGAAFLDRFRTEVA